VQNIELRLLAKQSLNNMDLLQFYSRWVISQIISVNEMRTKKKPISKTKQKQKSSVTKDCGPKNWRSVRDVLWV